MFNTKVWEKLIDIKKNKRFMSRFLLSAQKRPEEIDKCTGEYTFSVVQRYSFFADENQAVPTTN